MTTSLVCSGMVFTPPVFPLGQGGKHTTPKDSVAASAINATVSATGRSWHVGTIQGSTVVADIHPADLYYGVVPSFLGSATDRSLAVAADASANSDIVHPHPENQCDDPTISADSGQDRYVNRRSGLSTRVDSGLSRSDKSEDEVQVELWLTGRQSTSTTLVPHIIQVFHNGRIAIHSHSLLSLCDQILLCIEAGHKGGQLRGSQPHIDFLHR